MTSVYNEKEKEIIDLCKELELSARINGKTGEIHLYMDLGSYDCAEQAILYIKNHLLSILESEEEG